MPTQDELIQAELDGTIEELEAKADEQEATETPNEAQAEQPAEQPAEEVKPEPVVEEKPQADTTTNKQSSVMKLLKQRNEARARIEELEAQAKDTAELEARLKELEEGIAAQELEKEAAKERADFLEKYPSAKGHEEGIEKIRAEKDLSYSEAFQLYAAQNDPMLLMDEQYRHKTQSGATLTGVAKPSEQVRQPQTQEDFSKMSDDDFLAWSDGMARTERAAAGYVK